MIKTKEELKVYLREDKIALKKEKSRPSFFGDEIWKFEIYLRKYEYYMNRGGIEVLLPLQMAYSRCQVGL